MKISTNNQLVSIIIPCYNQEKYLNKSLKSCIGQGYKDIEIIVIDDGSTDQTSDIIDKFIRENKSTKIEYIYKRHSGPSDSRNIGIKKAKGQFIQLLDGDDYMEENKIKKQVDFLNKNKDIDIVYGSFRYEYQNRKTPRLKEFVVNLDDSASQLGAVLINGGFMPIHCFLIRREVFARVGLFESTLGALEDLQLWVRCIQRKVKFHFLEDNKASIYFIKGVSLSRNKLKMRFSYVKILENLSKVENEDYNQRIIKKNLLGAYLSLSAIESIRGNVDSQQYYYQKMNLLSDGSLLIKLRYLVYKVYYFIGRREMMGYEE